MLVIGLGNPPEQYARTPHNAGARVLDALATYAGCSGWSYDNVVRSETMQCNGWQLLKPRTYMNQSGACLRPLLNDRTPEEVSRDLVVIHDDIDMPLGTIKIVRDAGTGGHNGVASIENTLNTRTFVRIKIGVAPVCRDGDGTGKTVDEKGTMRKPRGEPAVTRYLLSPMSARACEVIDAAAPRVSEILAMIETDGVAKAMSICNAREEQR